jgi:polar amino acid transport system substrate-binding protein
MNFILIVRQLCNGFLQTLLIFALTLLFSLPLGLLVTFGRRSRFKPLQWVMRVYISIMRGTPLMLQLLVVCYGPYYLFKLPLSTGWRFIALIIGFVVNYAAYFAEIYRSGIDSIPAGQYEAANVLGYSRAQTFIKIILPQMIKRVIPPVTNEIITLVKDTSLAFVLAFTEMFTLAKQIAAKETNITPLLVAGLFYFVFNFIVAIAMERAEKAMAYYSI